MGRRSRKRSDGPLVAQPAPAPRPKPTGRASIDDRPRPPWHPVPLVELSVLAGIVLIVVGFLNADTSHGRIALMCGLALASLGGLDTALREHFNGYRSHTLLLAGLPGLVTAGVLFFARAPYVAMLAGAAAVFAAALWLLRRAFRSRAGVGFRA